ncbi:hypothetical protein F7U73_21260 [Vibrio vulnificus]|nr:hypothetical protein [Vibrio vulnificus]
MTSSLRPDESIQKLLISTTSKLVGEYENEAFLITNAHSHFASESGRVRGTESPEDSIYIKVDGKLVIMSRDQAKRFVEAVVDVGYYHRFIE